MSVFIAFWLGQLLNAGKSLTLALQKGSYMNKALQHEFQAEPEGTLTVRDNRTGSKYTIPIIHNAVPALGFRQICADPSGKTLEQQYEEGLRVVDPGYRNTAVKLSGITYINGNEGIILYRGHPLGTLVGKSYEEITHLLVWGELPMEKQRVEFRRKISEAMVVPPNVHQLIATFPTETPPMVVMTAAISAFMADQPDLIPAHVGKNLYYGHPKQVDEQIIRTLAISAVAVSLAFCHKYGREFRQPDLSLSYIENVLHMGGFVDGNLSVSRAKAAEILTKVWALYADHEMTNSTSAFLHVSSTLTDPLSSLIACASSGYGLLHGGAIDAAYRGMREIGGPENVPQLIERVVKKECRLSGYGHRIYKTLDPRAAHIRQMLDELTSGRDISEMDPVLSIAMEIDRVASTHEYFVKRNLQANADLYGSFVYTALGIPPDFATPLAMISRVSGIMAHWKEQTGEQSPIVLALLEILQLMFGFPRTEGAPGLWRPLQVYTGRK